MIQRTHRQANRRSLPEVAAGEFSSQTTRTGTKQHGRNITGCTAQPNAHIYKTDVLLIPLTKLYPPFPPLMLVMNP